MYANRNSDWPTAATGCLRAAERIGRSKETGIGLAHHSAQRDQPAATPLAGHETAIQLACSGVQPRCSLPRQSARCAAQMALLAPAVEAELQSALANQQYERVAPILDAAELESSNPDVLTQWPLVLHVLGHIYNEHLEDARFLWKRIPADAKRDNPELDAVWRLLQYCWNQHYAGTWQALQGFQWSQQVRPFVDALVAKTRGRMLLLLSEGYSLLAPAKAASLLGVPEAEVGHVVEAAGWRADMESGLFVTAVPEQPDAQLDGYENLQQLAQLMVHLES